MATENRFLDINNWPTNEEMDEEIEKHGSEYTASVWQLLQCQDKLVLTTDIAERYNYVQRAHIRLTGSSLPDTIKGAMKTKAQTRDAMGPEVKDEVLDKAIQGGMAARLKAMRGESND